MTPSRKAHGTAAGLGPGSAGDGTRAAGTLLVDRVASMRPWPGQPEDAPWAWELEYGSSGRKLLYVDPTGNVPNIRCWARTTLWMVKDFLVKIPGALVISGLVKTGKSFTLDHVVPAAMAEALREVEGVEDMSGMRLLRLNTAELNREEGAAVMLHCLLSKLLEWVLQEGVPVRERGLQYAKKTAAGPIDPTRVFAVSSAIENLMEAVEVPVLVLWDEVQDMFRPTINGKLDEAGATYIRYTLKHLLTSGPRSILWCLTGSSIALTYGIPIAAIARRTNLPATYDEPQTRLLWEQLEERFAPVKLDPRLLDLCPPSAALLAVVTQEWVDAGCPPDVAAFVSHFNWTKLIHESRREWQVGLEAIPQDHRLIVSDLATVGIGSRSFKYGYPQCLLWHFFFEAHVAKKADGRWCLKDSHQRQIVQLLLNRDGTARDSWTELERSASLTQQAGYVTMLRLGEVADYLLWEGARKSGSAKKPTSGAQVFKEELQSMADELSRKLEDPEGGQKGPQELWETQPWFQDVLLAHCNIKDRKWYNSSSGKPSLDSHLAMLVFYLRLSRKVLARKKRLGKSSVEVDLRVIEALPRALGWPLASFIDIATEMLHTLSYGTVSKAAKAYQVVLWDRAGDDPGRYVGSGGGGFSWWGAH